MRLLVNLCLNRSGAAAVEFAIVAPAFLMILLTFVGFAIYLNAANAVQQVAADAARTAIAGLNNTERNKLATEFISKSTMNYFMLDKNKLTVAVVDDPNNPEQFTVAIEYDAETLPIWSLYSFALPDKRIKRFSTIRIGGL